MKTSERGVRLIAEMEGFRAQAYQDVVGVWTIGYGFTKGVKAGDTMTRAAADRRLRHELHTYERAVLQACTRVPTQNQLDALVCFAFNVGVKGMAGSSVVKAHNRGDHQAAARAFGLWNKAGGKVWPGLTRRRAAEAALYLELGPDDVPVADGAEPAAPLQAMPQAVDPERPMTASSINRAGVVAGGTAAVATVTETVHAVNGLKDGVDALGNWLLPVLLLAVAGLCAYIVWERVKQRQGGWA